MAIKENNPNKLLKENNIPKIKANSKVYFIGGLVLNILKKKISNKNCE